MSQSATLKRNKRLDAVISILTALVVLLATAGILISAVWLYIKYNPMAGPETHINTYAKTITDENGKERYLMELDYWDNSAKNGYEVAEFSFNAYSGMDCTSVLQKGVQFWNNTEKNEGLNDLLSVLFGDTDKIGYAWHADYYDKDNGASWNSIEKIEVGTPMYLTIDGELYEMLMNGTYTTYTKQFNFAKSFINAFKGLAGFANYYDSNTWYDYLPIVHNYKMEDFYSAVIKSVIHNNIDYGTNILSLVDLSEYFSIRKFNASSKQWDSLTEGHDVRKSYFSVKVTKHSDGFRRAKDSGFGMFNNDPDFSLVSTDDYFEDYTGVSMAEMLTPKDFNYWYSAGLGGYMAELKEEVRSNFSEDSLYTISLNVDDDFFGKNKELVGFMLRKSDYGHIQAINVNLHTTGNTFYFVDDLTANEFENLSVKISVTNSNENVITISHRRA